MYHLSATHGTLATPWCSAVPGGPVDISRVPREVLRTWISSGVVVASDAIPDVLEMPENDILSTMDRKQLLEIIRLNCNPVPLVRQSWPDEAIRTIIRDMCDVQSLKLPEQT